MTDRPTAYLADRIFDGEWMHDDAALIVDGEQVSGLRRSEDVPVNARRIILENGLIVPGYVDLQVNGGGGVMFYDAPNVDILKTVAEAHARVGATSILPTLITNTPGNTAAAVEAAVEACVSDVPGIVGLHLEGPHLSIARKGAHNPDLIRSMTDSDVAELIEAAKRLPVLKVTIGPESVAVDQIRRLSEAGVFLSLGHTDCSFSDVQAAAEAGARCVTHLFNAMSQLGNREPGVVGGTLRTGTLSAGLIADLIHVHPAAIQTALAAKQGPGKIFLVSDAMATAGSGITEFELNDRIIKRSDGRLTLQDGTLAGADLDLSTAARNMTGLGVALETELAMATSVPADLVGLSGGQGRLAASGPADFLHLSEDLTLEAVWQGGARLPQIAAS